MRIAFVGKGGSGKSLLAGTFARLLGRAGSNVLVVDSDPMPGLAYSLGMPLTDSGIAEDVADDATATEVIERYAAPAPDGVRVLQLGKIGAGSRLNRASSSAFQRILDDMPDHGWQVVGDLPGGTRQPYFGWGRYADTVAVVVERSAASLLSARRLAALERSEAAPQVIAIANKVRDDDDIAAVRTATGLPVPAAIPYDTHVILAERRGRPLLDDAPDSPAVAALASLLDELSDQWPDQWPDQPLDRRTPKEATR